MNGRVVFPTKFYLLFFSLLSPPTLDFPSGRLTRKVFLNTLSKTHTRKIFATTVSSLNFSYVTRNKVFVLLNKTTK